MSSHSMAISDKIDYIAAGRKGTSVDDRAKGRLTKDGIRIYDAQDFDGMRRAGQLAARILDDIAPMIVPGSSAGTGQRPQHWG